MKSELAISSTLGNGIAAAPELVRAAAPERVRVRTAAPVKVKESKDEDETFGFDGDTKKSTASNTNGVATAQESLAGFGFEPTKSNPVVDGEKEFAGFGTSEGTIDTK